MRRFLDYETNLLELVLGALNFLKSIMIYVFGYGLIESGNVHLLTISICFFMQSVSSFSKYVTKRIFFNIAAFMALCVYLYVGGMQIHQTAVIALVVVQGYLVYRLFKLKHFFDTF